MNDAELDARVAHLTPADLRQIAETGTVHDPAIPHGLSHWRGHAMAKRLARMALEVRAAALAEALAIIQQHATDHDAHANRQMGRNEPLWRVSAAKAVAVLEVGKAIAALADG